MSPLGRGGAYKELWTLVGVKPIGIMGFYFISKESPAKIRNLGRKTFHKQSTARKVAFIKFLESVIDGKHAVSLFSPFLRGTGRFRMMPTCTPHGPRSPRTFRQPKAPSSRARKFWYIALKNPTGKLWFDFFEPGPGKSRNRRYPDIQITTFLGRGGSF